MLSGGAAAQPSFDPSSNSHDAREANEVWPEIGEEDGNIERR